MLSKESKIRVLENFYAVDYILFGKPASKIDTCCPMVREEYLSIKGALLSVHLEMLKLIEHNPKSLTESVDKTKLMDNAKKSARIAREQAQKIVTSKKARENIKESIKEALQENSKVNVSNLVEKQIRMKAFGLAIDNLLIARAIQEGSQYSELDSWEGQIIEDSYKILRDNLIEAAYMMIYNEDEEVVDEGAVAKGVALGALAGFLTPIPGGIIGGMVLGAATGAAVKALANWKKANQEKVEKYCAAKFGEDKAKYYECKALGRKAMAVELEKAKAKIKVEKEKLKNKK
jgi:hypothetical protein